MALPCSLCAVFMTCFVNKGHTHPMNGIPVYKEYDVPNYICISIAVNKLIFKLLPYNQCIYLFFGST